MGYTHYWERKQEIDKDVFKDIVGDIKKVMPFVTAEISIGSGDGEGRKFKLDNGQIHFNGVGIWHHEDFFFPRNLIHYPYNYVKTNRKPYDTAVVACLAIIKVHLGHDIHISTDGDDADWKHGIELCSNILGHEYDLVEVTEKNSMLRYKYWEVANEYV